MRLLRSIQLASAAVCLFLACPALTAPIFVSFDLSGLSATNIELEISLYDNSGTIGDSYALIDNVVLGADVDNFDDGTLGGFNNSLNPASVGVENQMLRIDEDPTFNPTIAYRDYTPATGSELSFDLELFLSEDSGSFGQDNLVFSLLDPDTLDPLVPGLTQGFGDVLSITGDGYGANEKMVSVSTSTSRVIPLPGAAILCGIGLGFAGLIRRRCF